MHDDARDYTARQTADDQAICDLLAREIDRHLPEAESRVWHAHPVWFLDGNPVVGYSKLKHCVRRKGRLERRYSGVTWLRHFSRYMSWRRSLRLVTEPSVCSSFSFSRSTSANSSISVFGTASLMMPSCGK